MTDFAFDPTKVLQPGSAAPVIDPSRFLQPGEGIAQQEPKIGVTSGRLYSGIAEAAMPITGPAWKLGGIGLVGAALSGPSDLDVLEQMDIRDEDRAALAERWFNKPLTQLQAERAAGAEPKTIVKDLARGYKQEIEQALPAEQLTGPAGTVSGASVSVAQSIPALAAAWLTKSPAVASVAAGAQAAGSTMAEGFATDQDAGSIARAGVVSGVAEAGLERLSLGFSGLLTKGAKNRFLRTIIGEELTEIPTTIIQESIEKIEYRPEETWAEFAPRLKQAVIDTALQVPLAAGAQSAIVRGLQRIDKIRDPAAKLEDDLTAGEQKLLEQIRTVRAGEELQQMGQQVDLAPEIAKLQQLLGQAQADKLMAPVMEDYRNQELPPEIAKPPADENATLTLMQELGAALDNVTEADLEQQVAKTKEAERVAELEKAAREATGGAGPEPATPLSVALDKKDVGQSLKATANAENYPNPNQGKLRSSLPIVAGPDELLGKTIKSFKGPGTVAIGEASDDRPEAYLVGVQETVEKWRQKYLPNAQIVISNEALPIASANGIHDILDTGAHLIVPPPLRRFEELGPGSFNPKTQWSAFYTLAHEFGHAIAQERLFETTDKALAAAVKESSKVGGVPTELVAQLPEDVRGLVEEYNTARENVVSGNWTARDVVNNWLGVQKTVRDTFLMDLGLTENEPGIRVFQRIAERAGGQKLVWKAKEGAKRAGSFEASLNAEREETLNDLLSLDEYFAEQTTRYAYTKQWDKGTALKSKGLFKRALEGLRQFFVELKNEQIVAPGVKFQEWMDGLTKAGRITGTAPEPEKAKGKAKPPSKPRTKKATPAPAAEPPVLVADSAPPTAQKTNWKRVMATLVAKKELSRDDPQYKEAQEALRVGAIDQVEEILRPYMQDGVKYSLGDLPEVPDVTVVDATDFVQQIQLQPLADPGVVGGTDAVGGPLTAGRILAVEGPNRDPHWGLNGTGVVIGKQSYPIGFTVSSAWQPVSEATAQEPDVLASAAKEWKTKGTRSPFFKAWFGDWEATGMPRGIVNADGTPWVGFHQTWGKARTPRGEEPFMAFALGDVGYHVGTLRAAHWRGFNIDYNPWSMGNTERDQAIQNKVDMTTQELKRNSLQGRTLREGLYTMPLFVNVRNPLDIGQEPAHAIWEKPNAMMDHLETLGVMNVRERAEVGRAVQRLQTAQYDQGMIVTQGAATHERFEPIRQFLEDKGFDGLVYKNTYEGDVSVVAFRPNQLKAAYGNTGTFSKSDNMHWDLDFDTKSNEGYSASKASQSLKSLMGADQHGALRRALRWLQYRSLELQQLAHLNPELDSMGPGGIILPGPLTSMVQNNDGFNRSKAARQAEADKIAEDAEKLPADRQRQMWKALVAEVQGGEHWMSLQRGPNGWEFVVTGNTVDRLKEQGITLEGASRQVFETYVKMKQSLLKSLNDTEKWLGMALAHRYSDNPALFLEKLREMQMRVQLVRKKPFFPRGDFGQYVIVTEEPSETGKGKTIVARETFESEKAWANRREYLERAKKPGQHIRAEKIRDREYVMMGLPHDLIETAAVELGLTQEEISKLTDIMQPVKNEKGLKPFGLPRYGLEGANDDWVRNYADFMWHSSNLIAKLEFRPKFRQDLRAMNGLLREAQMTNDTAKIVKYAHLLDFMNNTYDYIMAPPNELHMLRGLVSISYLGFNVKTALLNLYGAVTTWSDLASREGTAKGTARLLSSFKKAWHATSLTDLNAPSKGQVMEPATQAAYDRAIEEGVLAQSYAYHLAGIANSANLSRLRKQKFGGQHLKNLMDYSMWVFRLTELGTRRATFIAEFETAKQQGLDDKAAYDQAVANTSKLQNDYSYGNRVPFMRGVRTSTGNPLVEGAVPLATIFMSFAQHMAFHTFGGYEVGLRRQAKHFERKAPFGYTARIWLLTLLLAGYEGLPGAENILDLVDAFLKRYFGTTGRQELREMLHEVGGNPVRWAHGLAHDVGGFDVSRSVGFGRVVPGTDAIARFGGNSADPNQVFGSAALDLIGPFGGWLRTLLNFSFGPDSALEALSKGPGMVGALVSAYRWGADGVRTPSGAQLTYDPATGKVRDLTSGEILGKALGFNPTIVAQNREIRYTQLDAKMYWQEARSKLLEDYWEAIRRGDGEAVKDVKESVDLYNVKATAKGHPELRITPKQLADSVRLRRKRMQVEERTGAAPERRYRDMTSDIRESFSPISTSPDN